VSDDVSEFRDLSQDIGESLFAISLERFLTSDRESSTIVFFLSGPSVDDVDSILDAPALCARGVSIPLLDYRLLLLLTPNTRRACLLDSLGLTRGIY
jgi:hypothetical protein